jgi:hypothetical protein
MNKIALLLGILILWNLNGYCQEPTVDEILNLHFKARKMEKFQKINTIVKTGLRVQQDIMPLKIVNKRPNLYLMEFDVADLTAYQAFDGDSAWMTAPWTGNPDPRILHGASAERLIRGAAFDGPLYHWKEQGCQLELIGKDTVESNLVYQIKLVYPDSTEQFFFIGMEDYLLKKRISFRTYGEQQLTIETYYRDYRDVEGIPFAFLVETRYPGRSVETEVHTIELNNPIDNQFFKPPSE